jgi:hypothetical protein
MMFDCSQTQEELFADQSIRVTLHNESQDLDFLSCQRRINYNRVDVGLLSVFQDNSSDRNSEATDCFLKKRFRASILQS